MINFEKLFASQKFLDDQIYSKHSLKESEVNHKKYLALIIEFTEFVNETKVFKYWSQKNIDRPKMIEEYVDCLHFFLSFGKNLDLSNQVIQENIDTAKHDYTTLDKTLLMQKFVHDLSSTDVNDFNSKLKFLDLFTKFLSLKTLFQITDAEVEEYYKNKNEVNLNRQKNNY